jgi:hypothetical protein
MKRNGGRTHREIVVVLPDNVHNATIMSYDFPKVVQELAKEVTFGLISQDREDVLQFGIQDTLHPKQIRTFTEEEMKKDIEAVVVVTTARWAFLDEFPKPFDWDESKLTILKEWSFDMNHFAQVLSNLSKEKKEESKKVWSPVNEPMEFLCYCLLHNIPVIFTVLVAVPFGSNFGSRASPKNLPPAEIEPISFRRIWKPFQTLRSQASPIVPEQVKHLSVHVLFTVDFFPYNTELSLPFDSALVDKKEQSAVLNLHQNDESFFYPYLRKPINWFHEGNPKYFKTPLEGDWSPQDIFKIAETNGSTFKKMFAFTQTGKRKLREALTQEHPLRKKDDPLTNLDKGIGDLIAMLSGVGRKDTSALMCPRTVEEKDIVMAAIHLSLWIKHSVKIQQTLTLPFVKDPLLNYQYDPLQKKHIFKLPYTEEVSNELSEKIHTLLEDEPLDILFSI